VGTHEFPRFATESRSSWRFFLQKCNPVRAGFEDAKNATSRSNTKLNRNDIQRFERHCNALGLDYGEWLRSLIMREVRNDSRNVTELALIGEVTSLRLLLINTLERSCAASRRPRNSSKKCFAM